MSTNKWFRLYSEFLVDPKVQMLSEADQRRYIMVLCIRCNGHVTLQDEEVAFQLRVSNDQWKETKAVLVEKGLITDDCNPTAWGTRQYESDSSNARVSRFRAKKKQECNVTVTAPDTDTDTDTDIKTKSKDRSLPSATTAQKKAISKGTRLNPDWVLPKNWGEWALEARPELCADDIRREASNFHDHWLSQAGAKGVKADWLATWRKWIRSDLVKATGNGGAVKSSHWFMSSTGIEAKGAELGIKQEPGEVFPNFRNRIYRAAGVTDEMVRKAKIDAGERV